MPVNLLLLERLQVLDHYYGDSLKVPFPSHCVDDRITLWDVSQRISDRLISLFLRAGGTPTTPSSGGGGSEGAGTAEGAGGRPMNRGAPFLDTPSWQQHVYFPEYFNGDTGAGCGARHQGWTCTVVKLIQQRASGSGGGGGHTARGDAAVSAGAGAAPGPKAE